MKKSKFSTRIITRDLWKEFKEKNIEYKNMSFQEFYDLWGDISETIRTESIINPLGVKLGSYTGEIKLQYLPYKFEAAEYKISEELGKDINILNLISKGKVARIKWERRWAVKFNKILQYFAFEPTREMNHLAKKYIDGNPEKLRVSRVTLGGKNVWRNGKRIN